MSTHSECGNTGCYDCRADGAAAFARRLLECLEQAKQDRRFLLELDRVVRELEEYAKHEFELEA